MTKADIGNRYQIQCYKHNSKVHRAWGEAVFLNETDEYMVFGNDKTLVIESEGNTWRTKEPAIMYFFKDKWFNIIAQLKKDGIYYYCNIATPFIIEERTIKYIDYDLDLRIFPTGQYKVLDRLEYKYHKKVMNYSDELDLVINNALEELIELFSNGNIIFKDDTNFDYNKLYLELRNNSRRPK